MAYRLDQNTKMAHGLQTVVVGVRHLALTLRQLEQAQVVDGTRAAPATVAVDQALRRTCPTKPSNVSR